MLSFVVRNRRLEPRNIPIPRQRPGWALVKVRLAGICNTDLEILRGYHHFRGAPGHEFVGEVVKVAGVSASIQDRWLGQRAVGEINISCASLGYKWVCRYCRKNIYTHCLRRRVLGIVAHDGAFAEYLTLPLGNLHRVPNHVRDEQAVFTEPLAAACQILAQIPVALHREAALLGDGKLAQLIARVLCDAGLRVNLFGKHAAKLALARQSGITTTRVQGNRRDLHAVKRTYSLVVEATGSPSGLALAQQLTEPRGTLVLKSTFHGAAPVETWPLVVKEITLIGSRCGSFPRAVRLLRSEKFNLQPLITRVFSLREAPQAIRFAQKPGVMKVLLQP
jgi:alcohol dehydrogenase